MKAKRKVRAGTIGAALLLPLGLVAGTAEALTSAPLLPGVTYTGYYTSQAVAESHLMGGHPSNPEVVHRAFSRYTSALQVSMYVQHINPNSVAGGWEQVQLGALEIYTEAKTRSGARVADMALGASINAAGGSQYDNSTDCGRNNITIPGGTRIDRVHNRYIFTIPFSSMAKCGFTHGEKIVILAQSYLAVDNGPYSHEGQIHPYRSGQWTANASRNWYFLTY